jgi:tyrosinase
MTDLTPTRRQFLCSAGLAGALALLDGPRPGPALAGASDRKVFVRRDILSLDPDGPEIKAFHRGVAAMKARDPSDPTSWVYQANIHLTKDMSPTGAKVPWNQCQHGNYFFLPWHRMYLYWFERLLREASGDPAFAFPYWNYASPAARALPLVYRRPADASNPLYVAERNPDAGGINNGARLPASAAASYWAPFRLINFATPSPTYSAFGGRAVDRPGHALSTMGSFETYHNAIHVLIGGDGGFMSDLTRAARDPVFYAHHANVDRLWKRWLDQGGRANPVTDKSWLETRFTFVDEKGKPVEMSVKDCLDTEDQLGYRYDDDPPAVLQPPTGHRISPGEPKPLASSKGPPVELGTDGPARVTIDLDEKARAAIAEEGSVLTLLVEGLQFEKEPMIYYEVYLDLPADTAPDYQGSYYAGNLVFAGIGLLGTHPGHDHGEKEKEEEYLDRVRAFDVTATVRELRSRQLWQDEKLTVTFVLSGLVPVKGAPVTRPGVKARFERVTLAVWKK